MIFFFFFHFVPKDDDMPYHMGLGDSSQNISLVGGKKVSEFSAERTFVLNHQTCVVTRMLQTPRLSTFMMYICCKATSASLASKGSARRCAFRFPSRGNPFGNQKRGSRAACARAKYELGINTLVVSRGDPQ
jgi:hypothetical protein